MALGSALECGYFSACFIYWKVIISYTYIQYCYINDYETIAMKLQQLRYICAIARNGLSISRTAQRLHTSQPGISRQLRLLEEELGVEIFVRNGKQLSGISSSGEQIIQRAEEVLLQTEAIRAIAKDHHDSTHGQLSIATTHTQSRYILPPIIKRFISRHPGVVLHMHQGSPTQIARQAVEGSADFAIATEGLALFEDLLMMPCFSWSHALLIPRDHPLATVSRPSLQKVAEFPLVTYELGFTGRPRLDEAFQAAGLEPRVVFTAVDADVIKTYVRLGLGVGIIASMAVEAEQDADLVAIDCSHLFRDSITSIGFRPESYLRSYMYEFIEMFAPHLSRALVEEAISARSRQERLDILAQVELPRR